MEFSLADDSDKFQHIVAYLEHYIKMWMDVLSIGGYRGRYEKFTN